MKEMSPLKIKELARDIETELARLEKLATGMENVRQERESYPELMEELSESLALKLHNFYTGCERIFQLIASELNGGTPSGYDWHRRLLERMTLSREEMPPVLQQETAKSLREYLGFRHVVRNIYGFELDLERLEILLVRYGEVWQQVKEDLKVFVDWLNRLANGMENTL